MKRKTAYLALGGCTAMLLALSGCGGKTTALHTASRTTTTVSTIASKSLTTTVLRGDTSQAVTTSSTTASRPASKTSRTTTKPSTPSSFAAIKQGTPVSPKATPIVYTASMESGSPLSFDVGTDVDLRGKGQPWNDHIAIVQTYSELKQLYEQDQNPNKTKEKTNYMQAYDESFFKDNALIVLFIGKSSCSQVHQIDAVTKRDGRLCIGMRTRVQSPGSYWLMTAGDFRTLITVKKSDLQNITDVVVYNADWPDTDEG